jgi:hypothetical protein
VLEAMRWVRSPVASGRAKPEEIAIAAASPAGEERPAADLQRPVVYQGACQWRARWRSK